MTELRKICSDTGNIWSIAISPDGQYAITGSSTGMVKVWSIGLPLSHHSRLVAISSDGRFIAFSGGEGFFQLVSVPPAFSFVVHKGLVDQFILIYGLSSDETLLRSSQVFLSINQSTLCTFKPEAQFDIIISNSINRLTAPSQVSTYQWVEAICAVRSSLSIHTKKRSNITPDIISRYCFDLLQIINFPTKAAAISIRYLKMCYHLIYVVILFPFLFLLNFVFGSSFFFFFFLFFFLSLVFFSSFSFLYSCFFLVMFI